MHENKFPKFENVGSFCPSEGLGVALNQGRLKVVKREEAWRSEAQRAEARGLKG